MDTESELLTYQRLDSGIHSFVFHDSTREAVKQFSERLGEFYGDMARDETLCVLIDLIQSGIPPLQYSTQLARDLVKSILSVPMCEWHICTHRGLWDWQTWRNFC